MGKIKAYYHDEIEGRSRIENNPPLSPFTKGDERKNNPPLSPFTKGDERKERPILMSTPMVQAILEGRKTQTRRVIKPQPTVLGDVYKDASHCYKENGALLEWQDSETKCPYGQPGDWLWVREKFYKIGDKCFYKAQPNLTEDIIRLGKLKPSIHMPKAVARIWLEVTDVRVERLEDISNNDASAEGVKFVMSGAGYCGYDYFFKSYNLMTTPRCSFFSLWRTVHGIERYADTGNPFVWVVSFRVLSVSGRPGIPPRPADTPP